MKDAQGRRRLCIARALALEPEPPVAGEAVSALDVSVQALRLLRTSARGSTSPATMD